MKIRLEIGCYRTDPERYQPRRAMANPARMLVVRQTGSCSEAEVSEQDDAVQMIDKELALK